MATNQADIWVEVGNKEPFLVGAIYREWTSQDGKKSTSEQMGRLDKLMENLEKALHENKIVIYMGDVSLSKETFPKICVPQKCAINQC